MLEHLDHLLTTVHVVAGALVLLSGFLAMVFRPKGGEWHRAIGKVYFYGMVSVAFSALATIALFRFNLFLLVIGIFSFYLSFSGYRVLYRKLPGQQGFWDWAAALIALTAGLLLFGIGLRGIMVKGVNVAHVLAMVFGLMTALSAFTDIRIFRRTEQGDRLWWWYHHMQSMVGSYIAAFSAFTVQNGERFLPDFAHRWVFWIGPTIVGTPAIIFWIRYYRRKFGAD